MQAYEGFFEDGRFTPTGQAVNIRGRRRVVMAVYDDPAPPSTTALRAAWLDKLNTAIGLSLDEELPDLTRSTVMRAPLNLAD